MINKIVPMIFLQIKFTDYSRGIGLPVVSRQQLSKAEVGSVGETRREMVLLAYAKAGKSYEKIYCTNIDRSDDGTHIAGPTGVVRVVHDPSGVYAVTVRGNAGEQVVYLNESGAIVQAPGTTTTTTTVQRPATESEQTVVQSPGTTTVQTARPAVESEQTVVTYDQVQKNESRYELIEKKGRKEIYIDHQTGQKVIVKREKD
jgi:hypothetical protein